MSQTNKEVINTPLGPFTRGQLLTVKVRTSTAIIVRDKAGPEGERSYVPTYGQEHTTAFGYIVTGAFEGFDGKWLSIRSTGDVMKVTDGARVKVTGVVIKEKIQRVPVKGIQTIDTK